MAPLVAALSVNLCIAAVVFTILGEAAFTRSQLPAGAKGRPPLIPTVGAASAFAAVSIASRTSTRDNSLWPYAWLLAFSRFLHASKLSCALDAILVLRVLFVFNHADGGFTQLSWS